MWSVQSLKYSLTIKRSKVLQENELLKVFKVYYKNDLNNPVIATSNERCGHIKWGNSMVYEI